MTLLYEREDGAVVDYFDGLYKHQSYKLNYLCGAVELRLKHADGSMVKLNIKHILKDKFYQVRYTGIPVQTSNSKSQICDL